MKTSFALFLILLGSFSYAGSISQTWDYDRVEKELLDRSHVDIGYNFSNLMEGTVTDNAGHALKDLSSQGALRIGGHFTYLYLPKYFSLSVGLGYESPRRLNWNNSVNGGIALLNPEQRLSFWELNTLVHLDLPWFWEAYGGINQTIPLLSNRNATMKGNVGFLAGANYWWTRNLSTGLVYRINNFSYQTLGQSNEMSLSGLELRVNLKFL